MNAVEITRLAREQLTALTGLKPDTVSKLVRDGQGWQVSVELIELKAVPDSKDLLATYEAQLDEQGNVTSYRRTARYRRGDVQ